MNDNMVETYFSAILSRKGSGAKDTKFGITPSKMSHVLALLPSDPHDSIINYLSHCVPRKKGVCPGIITFLTPKNIELEATDLLPCYIAIKYGYFPIGSDGSGGPFTIRNSDGSVHHLYVDDYSKGVSVFKGGKFKTLPLSEANIEKKARQSWSSLAEFMTWLKSEIDKIVANETKTKSIHKTRKNRRL